MISYLQQFVNNFNKPKNWLVLANVFLVFFLIILSNLKVIPLRTGDFVFFTILTLAFALWRPSWAFLLFCGMVPLENINLAPAALNLTIRPYQLIGAILVLAILARLVSGRLNFKLAKLKIPDYLIIVIAVASFISAGYALVETQNFASLRLAVIFATFTILYFLVRNYIQNIDDAKRTVPFFLSSAVVVMLYGLWQNIIYLHGGNSFEVMLGRPNATFAEADWLGGYVVLLISLCYALIYYRQSASIDNTKEISNFKFKISNKIQNPNDQDLKPMADDRWLMTDSFSSAALYVLLTVLYIVLILTVSRSAWLAALATYVIFVWIFFTDLRFKNWQWKETSLLKLKIISALVVAILFVYIFHLTNFQLLNRAQSTGTGEQKITVSCEKDNNLPDSIKEMTELEKYDCRHINLEEIEKEKVAGKFVTEVNRPDPNVNVRAEIYQKSWQEIRNHPMLGIGWGSIGPMLGRDGRGTTLNASNIFLETYLGAGVLGFLALICLFGYILFVSVKNYFYATDRLSKTLNLFIIVGWLSLVIFNLFNAGIFLGFLWVWFAISQIQNKKI